MSIISDLSSQEVWEEYLAYKQEKHHLTRSEEKDLTGYISNREYESAVARLAAGQEYPLPEKKLIRKMKTDKKRTVYIYPREENYVFKLLTFLLLRRYDGIFSDSLYSFRIHTGVNKAMRRILAVPGLAGKYTYKADISNYFNSIPVERILEKLALVLNDEPEIFRLFSGLLRERFVEDDGKLVEEEKGVMAGTPFAVFLANVYLMELDAEFEGKSVIYARYSDDIIVLADSRAEVEEAAELIRERLKAAGLELNPEKERFTEPKEAWSFLGIGYKDGVVDISAVSAQKLKDKIRRRARAIRRWQIKKKATPEQAVKAFIRAMNRKFFNPDSSHELTWSRWYFPVINTDATLHELDLYMQYQIRYIATGRHNKSAYRFDYDSMKQLGYVCLVHEWYKERQTAKSSGRAE